MGKNDARFHFTNYARQFAEQFKIVKYFEIIRQRLMKLGPQDFGGGAAFGITDRTQHPLAIYGATAISVGDSQIMRFVVGLFEHQQRARHEEFYIIWVRP